MEAPSPRGTAPSPRRPPCPSCSTARIPTPSPTIRVDSDCPGSTAGRLVDTRRVRRFEFSDFARALAFVNKVGVLSEEEGHHPDITFGWGYTEITVFSHEINGLHENDFILAAKISQI